MSNCCYDSIIDCEILPEETIQAATDNTIEINTKAYTGVNTSDIQMNVDNENLTISAEFTQSEKINELIQKLDDDDFGKVDDFKVDNVSVVENKIGELSTINGDYNKDTNKLATENDIPTQASDVNALPDTTKYGASLSASGSTLQLKDQDGNDLGNPVTISTEDTGATSIEVVGDGNAVTSASYNENNRKITLNKGETFLKKNEYIVDDELSNMSENPVQNKVISELIPSNASSSNKLATKSEIPTKTSQLTNDSEFVTRTTDDLLYYTKSSEFKDLAFKDKVDYQTDVTNKPEIGNAIITIQQNHVNKGVFRLNQTTNELIDIEVPDHMSDLVNDMDYITKDVDDLTNYTKTSEFGDLAFEDSVDYETQVNNKPIIPVVNNGTLKIQKNGTTVATFNANSDQNVTANILVPEVNDGTLTIQKNGNTIGTFGANSNQNVTVNIEADQQVQSDWNQSNTSAPDYIKNKPTDLERTTNKVTSLSASSTDTQYPSAKTVYDTIKDITDLIPAQASSSNQLADKDFVNSSISTATATFRGTYNLVSDLSLTISATEQQIATAIASKLSSLSITPDNNDYCFVQIPTADATPTVIARIDRYKYDGTSWAFEYSLNNSGFTAAQWDAINSGLTSADKTKLDGIEAGAEVNAFESISVDGTSITPDANGDVALPISHGENNLGLVKTNWNYYSGLVISNNGTIQVSSASDIDISNRYSNKPIVPTKLNDSVKAALTDSNHLTMTADEQVIAKSVLGVTDVDISGKLDKVTSTAGDRRLYAINANGTQTTVILDYPNTASAGRVPCRSSTGALMINDSTYNNPGQFDDGLQAVNKNKLIEMTTALSGSSAPTTSTVGFVGQQYVNTTNNKVYECIAITTNDDVTTYTWKELTNNIESISAGGQALTPDANGNVNIPVGKDGGYNSTNKGVISVCSFSGLSLSSIDINGGHLWCASTTDNAISTRAKMGGVVPRILTNDKINDIVKAALTDSKHLTMTAAEQAVAKSVLGVATIKTIMDSVAEVNTEYYLGSQNSVDITLPASANAGDKITVDFTSGSTATTLTLTGNNIAGDTSFAPDTNKLIEMNFKYDGSYWKMLVSSLDIPSGV